MLFPFHMKTNLLFLMGLLHSTFCRQSVLPLCPGIGIILMYCLFPLHLKLIKETEDVGRGREGDGGGQGTKTNPRRFLTLGSALLQPSLTVNHGDTARQADVR